LAEPHPTWSFTQPAPGVLRINLHYLSQKTTAGIERITELPFVPSQSVGCTKSGYGISGRKDGELTTYLVIWRENPNRSAVVWESQKSSGAEWQATDEFSPEAHRGDNEAQ
jgi:hypothetical protein